MKAPTLIALSALLALSAGLSQAQSKTRDQVKAELAEAVRMGEQPIFDNGQTPRDINPSAFPARPALQSKTRDEVRAELALAIRIGDVPLMDNGMTPRKINPQGYPSR